MPNKTDLIEYDSESEKLRLELYNFLSSRGVMQKHIASNVAGISTCSVSLFLSKQRILTVEKMDMIRNYLNKYK